MVAPAGKKAATGANLLRNNHKKPAARTLSSGLLGRFITESDIIVSSMVYVIVSDNEITSPLDRWMISCESLGFINLTIVSSSEEQAQNVKLNTRQILIYSRTSIYCIRLRISIFYYDLNQYSKVFQCLFCFFLNHSQCILCQWS